MKPPVSHLLDSDMQNAPKALVRSAQRARQLAQETGTEFVYVRDGELIREIPQPTAEISHPVVQECEITGCTTSAQPQAEVQAQKKKKKNVSKNTAALSESEVTQKREK